MELALLRMRPRDRRQSQELQKPRVLATLFLFLDTTMPEAIFRLGVLLLQGQVVLGFLSLTPEGHN